VKQHRGGTHPQIRSSLWAGWHTPGRGGVPIGADQDPTKQVVSNASSGTYGMFGVGSRHGADSELRRDHAHSSAISSVGATYTTTPTRSAHRGQLAPARTPDKV